MATKDDNTHITVILDTASGGCEHFTKQCPGVNVVEVKGGTEASCFREMVNYICAQELTGGDSIVYMLEDDYIHKAGWPTILREAFAAGLADYVTMYDHPDKYDSRVYPSLDSKVFCTPSVHWRSTPSTTNTYAVKLGFLKKNKDTHLRFSEGVEVTRDHAKFLHLQGELGQRLMSSIPAYSTHVETAYLSPCVDWRSTFLKHQNIKYA
jgi:hypothetical protein